MSFYNDISDIKYEVLQLRDELGDPRVKTLVFEFPSPGFTYTYIIPKPKVSSVPPKFVGMPIDARSNATVRLDDFFVQDVPRIYPQACFSKVAWLDASIVPNSQVETTDGTITAKFAGTRCKCILVNDSDSLAYSLILRKDVEQIVTPFVA